MAVIKLLPREAKGGGWHIADYILQAIVLYILSDKFLHLIFLFEKPFVRGVK